MWADILNTKFGAQAWRTGGVWESEVSAPHFLVLPTLLLSPLSSDTAKVVICVF